MNRIMPENQPGDLSLQQSLSVIESRLTRRFIKSFSPLFGKLGLFSFLVLLISLSGCTETVVKKEPCPSSYVSECPACQQCPTCESSRDKLASDETQARVFISDLSVKDAKITRLGKAVKCESVDKVSDIALFLVYEYNITWKFPQVKEFKVPPYNPQVTVIGEGDSGEYQATDKLFPEVKEYKSSLTPSGDVTQFRSSVKLTLGPTCESVQLKAPYMEGIFKPDGMIESHKIISPKPGKFTLTLFVDGQELSKEFVVTK